MNEITTRHSFRCDLNAGTLEVTLDAPLMHQDALGDVFSVSVWRSGSPVELDDVTVRGYLYLAATQQTVLLNGSASGSSASVTLDSSCYAVPGHASLVIQLQKGTVRHTVLKADFVIDRTCTDTVIDPGSVLPTLPELLAQIAAMEQATAKANAAAANADAAREGIQGDLAALTEEKPQFLPIRTASSFRWNFGTTIYANGEEENGYFRGALTDMIPVEHRVSVLNLAPALDHKGREYNVFVAEFTDGVFVKRTQLVSGYVHNTAAGTNGIKLLAVYPSSVAAEMTINNLKNNFAVGFVGNIIPGDGKRPKYVAFGASTTVGAVHWPDKAHTYTPYAFPDYIGQVLGLETTNLGNGATGFVARNDGASPNFMDAIYNNHETLKKADLITLSFGWGNDRSVFRGEEADEMDKEELAELDRKNFGKWNDYFPYDEVGAFYVDGETASNRAGIDIMKNAGATLMGCLNWCIKWIGEHYPQATLVCIYGAPSGNSEYKVEVIDNAAADSGTAGVAPQKVSVKNRTSTNDATVNTLREKLNIPIINMRTDGLPFSYYNTMAKNDDGTYAVFSTVKNEAGELVFNTHPNEVGYLMYARYLAGRVSEYFKH